VQENKGVSPICEIFRYGKILLSNDYLNTKGFYFRIIIKQ